MSQDWNQVSSSPHSQQKTASNVEGIQLSTYIRYVLHYIRMYYNLRFADITNK